MPRQIKIRDLVRFYKGLPDQDAALVLLDETLAAKAPELVNSDQEWYAIWSKAGKQTIPNPPPTIVPPEGLALLKEFEGCELEAYDDGVGVWTIGWGETRHFDGAPVKKGDRITQSVADAMLDNRLKNFVLPTLKRAIPGWDKMNESQRGALMSFAYNVGGRAFCQSTLVKKLNARDYPGACQELLRWRFFQGKDCATLENAGLCGGLVKRRDAEYRQCIGETAP